MNGDDWLRPEEVAAHLRQAFSHVSVDAEAARATGANLVARYREIRDAGLGNAGSTPVEELEAQWAGALSIIVDVDPDGRERFHTNACVGRELGLEFGPGVSGRRRKPLAQQIARALGYVVSSVDGD